MTSGSLLVAGTTSDAGKSVLTAGICRWLARQGVKVAPFKAQNMSNNSMVTPDGAEIGRAQAMQAAAAGLEPEAAMNPLLHKPGSDQRSQLVVMGRAAGAADAREYWSDQPARAKLFQLVLGAYDDLRSRFDVVICEGAGSPAEINLRRHDLVNMGLARARQLPVLVVGDIDRGGVFAALYGTVALLEAADQALISGFVINKFRGERTLLTPGLDMITALTRRAALPDRDMAGCRGRGRRRGTLRRPGLGAASRRRDTPDRRGPAAAHLELHRCRCAGPGTRGRPPIRHDPGRTCRCRPGRPARHPGHRRRPALAARTGA
jgi:cobyric acid synthase